MLSRLTLVAYAAAVLGSSLFAQAAAPYRVYMTDRADQVRAFSSSGTELSASEFTSPTIGGIWGLATDTNNQRLFAGSTSDGLVRRLNADGSSAGSDIALTNGVTTSTYSFGMDVGADGTLYVIGGNGGGHQLWRVDPVTAAVSLIPLTFNALPYSLSGTPYDVAGGPDGFVYVIEVSNDRVLKIDPSTGLTVQAIGYGGGNVPPQVDNPHALDFDANGVLSVVDVDRFPDAENSTQSTLLRHFSTNPVADLGSTWTIENSVVTLHLGVAVGPDGRTFVTSYNSAPVQVFSVGGTASTFATVGALTTQVDVLLLPEPASAALTGLGMVLLAGRRRRA